MPDPAPLSVDTPNVLDLRFILVTVRTDFLWRNDDGSVTFHWIKGGGGTIANPENGEVIAGATVELLGINSGAVHDTAITDQRGQTVLETSQLLDGNYTVKITPKNSRDEFAGPEIADPDPAPLPDRMYHPLEVAVRLSGGLIELAVLEPDIAYASLGNRVQPRWPPPDAPTDHLPIDLKPIWMRKERALLARADDKLQMIVVHNTAGEIATGAINQFKGPLQNGAHYLIDLNGHTIKFAKDHDFVVNAGGKWRGKNPNDTGIGIEIVHKEGDTEYTRQQYPALIDLLKRLVAAYGIDPARIVGHSDVGTRGVVTQDFTAPDADVLDGSRDNDPGQVFHWERLEEQGLGIIPQEVPLGDAYGKLFNGTETVVLKSQDNDASHKYGGKPRPGTPGKPIRELQQDLTDIGYSVHMSGIFDESTELAVKAFQRHFFSGNRRRAADGRLDRETAQMIKNVKGAP